MTDTPAPGDWEQRLDELLMSMGVTIEKYEMRFAIEQAESERPALTCGPSVTREEIVEFLVHTFAFYLTETGTKTFFLQQPLLARLSGDPSITPEVMLRLGISILFDPPEITMWNMAP